MPSYETEERSVSKSQPDRLSAAHLSQLAWQYSQSVGIGLHQAVRRWQRDDAATMAAAVAYYLALSLFPLIILLISGVGLVLKFTQLGQTAEQQLLEIISEHCSPTLEVQCQKVLEQLESQSIVGGPFGLMTAILAAIGVFYQFERSLDKIWRSPTVPSQGVLATVKRVLAERFAAFMLLTGVGLTMILIAVANVAIGVLRQWMSHLELPGTVMIAIVDASTTTLLNALAFSALYCWIPKEKIRWRTAFRGGMLVAVMWEVGRQLLSSILISDRYTTAYGAVGAFIALLLWFYWGCCILFFGAEYVKVLTLQSRRNFRMFQANGVQSEENSEADDVASSPVILKFKPRPSRQAA